MKKKEKDLPDVVTEYWCTPYPRNHGTLSSKNVKQYIKPPTRHHDTVSIIAENTAASWVRRFWKTKNTVYLAVDYDPYYLYGVFSTKQRAKKFLRTMIKKDASPWSLEQLRTNPSFIGPYDIQKFIVDERVNEVN